jgi:hypothetical protein
VTHDIARRKDTSPEKEEVYEKASDAETAADNGAGDTQDEADDVETKELRRNGAAEAPSRPAACLRGRGAPPRAAEGKGRREGSAARRESIRQVEAEGEADAKASMVGKKKERASERRSVVGEGGDARRCRYALKRITSGFCCRLGFAVLGRKPWA